MRSPRIAISWGPPIRARQRRERSAPTALKRSTRLRSMVPMPPKRRASKSPISSRRSQCTAADTPERLRNKQSVVTQDRINLLDQSPEDLEALFGSLGEKPFRARQVLRWVHQRFAD